MRRLNLFELCLIYVLNIALIIFVIQMIINGFLYVLRFYNLESF